MMRHSAGVPVALMALAVTVSACGSSKKTSIPPAKVSTTSSAQPSSPRSAGSTAAPSPSGGVTKALPSPCALLTAGDVAAFFGNVPLDFLAQKSGAPGQSECVIERKVGTTAKMISLVDHVNFDNDQSYIFPNQNTTAVTSLGYPAVLEHPSMGESMVTVKLGKNALAVSVDFYTSPVNDALVIQLTKTALSRI